MTKPKVGEYFVCYHDHVCVMVGDNTYTNLLYPNIKSLNYVQGSPFSKKRDATKEEIFTKYVRQPEELQDMVITQSYTEAKADFEKTWLVKIMQETKYNQSKAANRMGISRGNLRTKLKHYFGNEYFRDKE